MLIDEIDLPQEYIHVFQDQGITELYPPQAEAIPHIQKGENLLMAVPTAAGKSLAAYIGALRSVLAGGKALYIVPLRALAWEKIEELRKFEKMGLKVGVSLGDYDSSSRNLGKCDIVVATAEKADSLLRHRAEWLKSVKVVIADEVHLLQDAKRGPTMEVILARFKSMGGSIQIIALSATVPNSSEIAEWLCAVHVKSEWRPVSLQTFVYNDGTLFHGLPEGDAILEKKVFASTKRGEDSILTDSFEHGYQCLIFVNTRNRAASLAKRMSSKVDKHLSSEEREALKENSRGLVASERGTTDMARELGELMKKGTAYHHAGLTDTMRKAIEGGFRKGFIKIIAATPTLAAGVNLPARRVIVRDTYRYDGIRGMVPVSVLEVKQMCGRAGRPGYDSEGEAFIIASSREKIYDHINRYLLSDGEEIQSKLGTEGALRIHMLSSIASGFVTGVDSMEKFIDSTLYAHQSDPRFLRERISRTIDFLLKNGFLKYLDENGDFQIGEIGLYPDEIPDRSAPLIPDGEDALPGFQSAMQIATSSSINDVQIDKIRFYPTEFGIRTSNLYIDPVSALNLRNALQVLEKKKEEEISELGILHALCSCPDMNSLYLRKADNKNFREIYFGRVNEFLVQPPSDVYEFEFFLSEIKTASLLNDWIEEMSEDDITKKYSIGPGDIRGRVEVGQWLMYSMKELGRLFQSPYLVFLENILSRIRQGIKEELLDLVSIRDVGRVRARGLFKAEFRDLDTLAKANVKQLMGIRGVGKILAEKIIREAKRLQKETVREK